ncbi:type III effector protein, HopAC1 family [Pseudomonas trivialis]|uniref:Type III effector protein, HopAC1 family n=1 Tax=Pseudomonas trivialis TaxID=200450 RepID=A0A0R2ZMA4_9PSED|nr:type III effector protein, HopAC1 family [Pseudomonas trivialis]
MVQEVKAAPGGGFEEVSVNPDPGKNVGTGEKLPVPIDLGLNINIDPVTKKISDAFKSVDQEASIFLKKTFAQMAEKATTPAEKEKWNIDPDKTFLVTFDYNATGERPYPANILKRISLTQALITNAQDTPKGSGFPLPFFEGGPDVIVKPELTTHAPGTFDFFSRFNPGREKADITHTYQGIYQAPADSTALVYNAANQRSITPTEFKELIWDADYQQPYEHFLDEFWTAHQEKYPALAKASFVKAAMTQHQQGSLPPQGLELAMLAAGLSGNQASWPDIKFEDLLKNPPKDPGIEVGLLKIGNYESTDLIYITDNRVSFDANGNKLPALTLVYEPGSSSPFFHTFNSQAEMKTGLAAQMADPVRRAALATHVALKDRPNGIGRAGADETMAGLGTWPQKRETPGGLLSYDHRAFSGFWDPQTYITTAPSKLPFDEVARRQKSRAYADGDFKITSDRDYRKEKLLSGLEKVAKIALFLTPLALVVPEVALAIDAYYLASGVITAAIGVDNNRHGKANGNEQILNGVLNAVLVATPRAGKFFDGDKGAASEVTGALESAPNSPAPSPPRVSEWPANRLRPSQWHSIGDSIVTDGERRIEGVTPNAMGIYQVKGPHGKDQWLIRLANNDGTHEVFEIDAKFKLRNGYAQVIDPLTEKAVMNVQYTGGKGWEPLSGPGGIKLPWKWGNSQGQPFDPGAYDYPADGTSSTSKAITKIDNQLKKDAESFHKTAKTKPRPALSTIHKNASPAKVIDTIYQKSSGMIIGEDHSQSAGLKILIDHAAVFRKNGVRVLYSEGFEHALQPDLDRFFDSGEFSPALRKNLKLIDLAHSKHGIYTNRELLLTLRKNGIRIKAIDVPSVEKKTTRLKNMNYYASKVIEKDQALDPQQKWIVRVGSDHVFTYEASRPIRGISELTGATGVLVDDAPVNTETSVIQPPNMTDLFIDLKVS